MREDTLKLILDYYTHRRNVLAIKKIYKKLN
jgi:hypothetical protein